MKKNSYTLQPGLHMVGRPDIKVSDEPEYHFSASERVEQLIMPIQSFKVRRHSI